MIDPLVVPTDHHVPIDLVINHGDSRDMLHFNVSHVVGSINIKSILTIPLLFYATKFAYPREVAVSEGDVPLDHVHNASVYQSVTCQH